MGSVGGKEVARIQQEVIESGTGGIQQEVQWNQELVRIQQEVMESGTSKAESERECCT